uniref:NADH dehydrogenase subunit 4L n=1 Tax=Polyplax asiatica TaxID=1425297 RepID=V9PXB7_9NEOP|nr:NADH dehydrogenase subunit 4L [Polyplax asiatica]
MTVGVVTMILLLSVVKLSMSTSAITALVSAEIIMNVSYCLGTMSFEGTGVQGFICLTMLVFSVADSVMGLTTLSTSFMSSAHLAVPMMSMIKL